MADTAAVGYGPITFFIGSGTGSGSEISIPISEIYFDAAGDVHSYVYGTTPGLTDWLKYLVDQGRIVRGTATVTPAGDAMIVTAAEPGTVGNNITIEVVAVDATHVNLKVTETDRYDLLTLASLETVLGSSTVPGSKPGLVRFLSLGTGDPVNGPGTAVPATTPPNWTLANAAATTAFTLEARRTGTVPARVAMIVSNVAGLPGARTFTLEVTWTSAPALNVDVTGIAAFATANSFAVTITPPTGGYKLPKAGTVRLGGGVDPAQASTTLLASS